MSVNFHARNLIFFVEIDMYSPCHKDVSGEGVALIYYLCIFHVYYAFWPLHIELAFEHL